MAASVTAATATSLQIVVPTTNCKPAGSIAIDVTVAGATSAPRSHPFRPATFFTLAEGQQRLIPNATDFCLQFEATQNTETYLVGVQSVSELVTNLTPVTVTSEGASAAASSIPPAIASAPVFSARLADPSASRNAR